MAEASVVASLYHLLLKSATGREGPKRYNVVGKFGGPATAVKRMPEGTPSGHATVFYSMLAVSEAYFERQEVSWLGHLMGLYLCVGLIHNDQHFLSDVLWGAPLGYYIGKSVAHNRLGVSASKEKKVDLMPYWHPNLGPALQVAFNPGFFL